METPRSRKATGQEPSYRDFMHGHCLLDRSEVHFRTTGTLI